MRWCPSATRAASRSATTVLCRKLLLCGRNAERVAAVARAHNIADWTTDLDAALADPAYAIFFDAAATQQRVGVLEKAIAAGKHIYSEKPVAPTVAQGLALLQQIKARGLKHGAVEDKVHLPGLQKLARADAKRRARPRRRLPARIRLVGVRRHRPAVPAAELELSRRRRRPDARYVSALALRDRSHRRPHRARLVRSVDRDARAHRRTGRALSRRGRRFRRHAGRARERRLRHDPELVGDARAPRRPVHLAGRRHKGLRDCDAASLPRAVHGPYSDDQGLSA